MELINKIHQETNWFKKARMIRQYHETMLSTKGNKRGEKWTLGDTARSLSYSIGYVSESITLASHEELSNFSRYVALKVLRNGHE